MRTTRVRVLIGMLIFGFGLSCTVDPDDNIVQTDTVDADTTDGSDGAADTSDAVADTSDDADDAATDSDVSTDSADDEETTDAATDGSDGDESDTADQADVADSSDGATSDSESDPVITLSIGSIVEFGDTATIDVMMTSEEDVFEFQFDVSGVTVTGAGGGSAAASEFEVTVSEGQVSGTHAAAGFIASSTDTALVQLLTSIPSDDSICLSNPVFTGIAAQELEVAVPTCD